MPCGREWRTRRTGHGSGTKRAKEGASLEHGHDVRRYGIDMRLGGTDEPKVLLEGCGGDDTSSYTSIVTEAAGQKLVGTLG